MADSISIALNAYRHVLRSTRIAFQGDQRLLHAARNQARHSFASHSSLLPASPEAIAQIAHAEDVARVLRRNLVQGQKVEGEGGADKYQLRIHDETERGDNDTIKPANNGMDGTISGNCRAIT